MSQETSLDKLMAGKTLVDSKFKIKFKTITAPFLLALSRTKVHYKLKRKNDYKLSTKRPVIFAVNHSNECDVPMAARAIKGHAYFLTGKQPLAKADEFFFKSYGCIFIDRKNKEDMHMAKKVMEAYLEKGENIVAFLEGTWNATDAELMLPLKWGMIEIAQNSNAVIIPTALEYYDDKKECHAKFGEEFDPSLYFSKAEAISDLRDQMATLRYDFFEQNGMLDRGSVEFEQAKEKNANIPNRYPLLDWDYEQSIVYRPYTTPEEVYAPVKKLELKKENAFLFSKNLKG